MKVVEPGVRRACPRVERERRPEVCKVGEAGALRCGDPCDIDSPALEIAEKARVGQEPDAGRR